MKQIVEDPLLPTKSVYTSTASIAVELVVGTVGMKEEKIYKVGGWQRRGDS